MAPAAGDASREASVMSTMRKVASTMAVLARADIGPAPEVPTGPVIYAANHRSMADLLLASLTFHEWGRPIRPLVAASYFDTPLLGGLLRRLMCIPVTGKEALEAARGELEAGWSIAIMPEGRVVPPEEWAPTGVGRTHPGVGRLAMDTRLPVVACGASGTEALWPLGRPLPHLRPWRRFPLALRSEVIGPVEAETSRIATAVVVEALERAVRRADSAVEAMRRSD